MSNAAATDSSNVQPGVPCVGCGYELRGLPADGTCPECGHSIADSLEGDWLFRADPKWLARVRLGVTCVLAALLLGAVLWAGGLAARFTYFGLVVVSVIISAGLNLLLAALHLVGVWWVTTPSPLLYERTGLTVRRAARGAALAGLLSSLPLGLASSVRVVLLWEGDPAILDTPVWRIVGWSWYAAQATDSAAALVAFTCLAVYLRSLAKRISRRRLVRAVTIGLWAGVATHLQAFLAYALMPQLAHVLPASVLWPLIWWHTFAAEVVVLFNVFWFVVLFGFRRHLGKQVERASARAADAMA